MSHHLSYQPLQDKLITFSLSPQVLKHTLWKPLSVSTSAYEQQHSDNTEVKKHPSTNLLQEALTHQTLKN